MIRKKWVGRSAALFCLCAVTALAAGCDMFGSESGAAQMTVKFGATTGVSKLPLASKSGAADELALVGTNGDQLTITDVRLLVEKLKFERDDDACEEKLEGAEVEDDRCEEEFESDPFMIDLPLSDGAIAVATGEVPPGVYTKFEFEVGDLDRFEDTRTEGEDEEVHVLADAVRAEFPEWPEDASMVVVGTFTPAGGEPQSFTTYIEAEIEVEMALEPALELAEGSSEALRVEVLPEAWFVRDDGSLENLAAYSSVEGQEHELLELTLKLKDGFSELRVEREDD